MIKLDERFERSLLYAIHVIQERLMLQREELKRYGCGPKEKEFKVIIKNIISHLKDLNDLYDLLKNENN